MKETQFVLLLVLGIVAALAALGALVAAFAAGKRGQAELRHQLEKDIREELGRTGRDITERQNTQLEAMRRTVNDQMTQISQQLARQSEQNEAKLEAIRRSTSESVKEMRESNEKRLDEMRNVVDEKLQKTLEERIAHSFETVNKNLEAVYKGLGDMKNLAGDVGSLKQVLSNVKTRGMLGEIQLGAILEEILSPEQYDCNVVTIPNRTSRVEFALKLPGDGDGTVYMPIDSKFPLDLYQHLLDAYETGDNDQVSAAWKQLENRIKECAKDIREKYIEPPYTTDFGILFLPTEGLYAEVVRRGMIEPLQRQYKINVAGPTTMAALLNSLQMGFRTLAIQKRSGEVWQLLSAVKTEFNTFADVLENHQKHLNQASQDLEKLVGTRTNKINKKLRDVECLPQEAAAAILED